MAFVVPAEIGRALYAAPLLDYLVNSFSEVHIIAIRRKLVPSLSEDCWLLYANGHGGSTSHIGLTVLVGADEAAVGDGDAMGVAAEIGEHPFGRSERRLGIDDPALLAQRTQRPSQGVAVAKRFKGAEEA